VLFFCGIKELDDEELFHWACNDDEIVCLECRKRYEDESRTETEDSCSDPVAFLAH
jgi:hypothetical protein